MAFKTYLVGTREPSIENRLIMLYEKQTYPDIVLRRRRNDKFDENSIAVVYGKQSVIGYLPKEVSALVIEHFNSGREHELKAEIYDIIASDSYLCIINMNIEVTNPETGEKYVEYKYGEWQNAPQPRHWWSEEDDKKLSRKPSENISSQNFLNNNKESKSILNLILGVCGVILIILAMLIFG